jgi:TolA-binding protein/tetratricopeptide (TPR) repeat protein
MRPASFRQMITAIFMLTIFVSVAHAAEKRTATIEDELKLRAGDEQGNELKALKTEMLVMRSEKKALEQLEKLKVRYKGTRMEPEILFRLGEIYMRRARTERFFEVHRDSNQIVRFAPELVRTASEVKQIRRAISIYLDLETRFPRFRARDIVVFNTAYAYQQVGEDLNAEKQFQRLLSHHPNSSLVPDALLSLGEIQYSRRQFSGALAYFLKIKEHPEARVYPYGLYKAAWCKYNMQDETAGIKLLEDVVAFGHQRAKDSASSSKLDLRKEALGDLALFFSESKKAQDAVTYFAAQAQDLDAVPYILRLVEIYKRHSKYGEVDIVLRDILSKLPQTTMIADVHEELIWNADRQKKRDVAVKQLVELDRTCDSLASKKVCDGKVVEISKKLGAKLHAYWKRDKLPETADQALKAYEVYLGNTVLVGHEAAQVRYAYADLMFARSRFREASANYALVNDLVKEEAEIAAKENRGQGSVFNLMKTDPKLAVDAAYGAVVALEKAVGDGQWSDADEQTFGKLGDRYLARAPKGPYALDVKFKRAFIAYEKEKFDIAASGFKAIGWSKENLEHPKVMKAQDLYLDILNIRKDYTGLKDAAYLLLAMAPAAQDEKGKARSDQLAKIRREAWFAEVGELEQKSKKNEELYKAVEMYRSFALDNRTSELAPRAWWNASQILFRTSKAAEGAAMCAQMHKNFPGSANSKECLQQAVQTYESIARLDLASGVALNLAEIDKDKAKSEEWKNLATEFLALSGARENKDQALRQFLKQVDEKGQTKQQQADVVEKAFQLAKEIGDDRQISAARLKIESLGIEPHASRFLVEEAEAVYKAGDSSKAFNLAKRVVGRESQLSQAKNLPARARLLQARVLEDEYRSQSVKARVDRIGIVLAIKTEKLEKAQKAYQSAAKMGDPSIAIESQSKLAELYIDYSKTVRAMKLPADVPEADQKAFAQEIEQIALPMEEKGIEALSQAVDAAKKTARLDGLAGELQRRLDRLNMKADSGSEKITVEPLPRVVPGFNWKLLGSWNRGVGK